MQHAKGKRPAYGRKSGSSAQGQRRSRRMLGLVFSIGLTACSATDGDRIAAGTARALVTPPPSHAVAAEIASREGAFDGAWRACEGAASADQCGRYALMQRGERICGTWSYFATGDAYEGRVVAQVVSPNEARRTHVCGRPGSETRTECENGWDRIDKPLRLCDGKLGDLQSKDGGCFADFERDESAGAELTELAEQPWLQACLAGSEPEGEQKGAEAIKPLAVIDALCAGDYLSVANRIGFTYPPCADDVSTRPVTN